MHDKRSPRCRTGILIFDDVEVLDFCGPFEVLSVTRLDEAQRATTESPYDVRLIGKQAQPVVTRGGMVVTPHHCFVDCPALDLLIVPGGLGTRALIHDTVVRAWLQDRANQVARLTSVCTGALVLGHAGLLDGRRATTHWHSLDWMQEALPAVDVVRDEHVVTDGNIITSAGISAGIEMALAIVCDNHGESVARATARHMEYRYPEDNRRRVTMP